MGQRITCPRCEGQVSLPDRPPGNVVCPFCRQFLVAVDPSTGATWVPKRGRPKWMPPPGRTVPFLILIAILFVVDQGVNPKPWPTIMGRLLIFQAPFWAIIGAVFWKW